VHACLSSFICVVLMSVWAVNTFTSYSEVPYLILTRDAGYSNWIFHKNPQLIWKFCDLTLKEVTSHYFACFCGHTYHNQYLISCSAL
jgi:hypothetical protein